MFADAATARANPAPIFALHPGTHDANKIFDYSTKYGGGLYAAATAALPGIAWDHTLGNTLGISNMLGMRTAKSGWATGTGDILTIKDNVGTDMNLVTKYGLLTVTNIDTHFSTCKTAAGRQLQNSAQLTECLLASISAKTAQIVMAESHLWMSQGTQSGKFLFKLLMNNAIIDNKHTTEKLRNMWENMPSKMSDLGSNIEDFVL